MAIGDIQVDLRLMTAKFNQSISETNRHLAGFESKLGLVKKAVVGVAAVLAVNEFAKLITETADAARELENMANVANTGVEQFQGWTFAAKTVGIQSDKLSDILKDVNDRVGEFVQTGGGPMQDFFNNIAPKIGVTAAQFRNLSGPEALQLYVSSLEKANLNQADMTFYMEALSSDSTKLLPLLLNNGKAMRDMATAAGEFGAVAAADDVAKLTKVANELDQAHQIFAATKMTFVANLADVDLGPFKDALGNVHDIMVDPKFAQSITDVAQGLVTLVGWAMKGVEAFADLAHWMIKAFTVDPPQTLLDQVSDSIDAINERLKSDLVFEGTLLVDLKLPTGEVIKKGTSVADLEKRRTGLIAMRDRWVANPIVLPTVDVDEEKPRPGGGGSAPASKATQAIQKQVTALQMQAQTLGMTKSQAKLYELAHTKGITPALLASAKAALATVDAYNGEEQAWKTIEKLGTGSEKMAAHQAAYNRTLEQLTETLYPALRAQGLSAARAMQMVKVAAADATNPVAGTIRELERQADTLGMNADQLQIYKARQQGATGAQLQQIDAIQKTITAYNNQQQAWQVMAKFGSPEERATAYQDIYNQKLHELNETLYPALIANNVSRARAEELVGQAARDAANQTTQAGQAGMQMGWAFSSAFEDAITQGKKFSEVLVGLAQDIEKIILRSAITQPLGNAIGGWVGNIAGGLFGGGGGATINVGNLSGAFGGGGGSLTSGWHGGMDFSGLFANAKGGVYAGDGISAFSGQIVNSPTVFPFAHGIGLMGEAGPEAIMPLTRGPNGKLGVQGGGSTEVVVQVIDQRTQGGEQPQVEQKRGPNGEKLIRVLIRDQVRRSIDDGSLDRNMNSAYGLRRRGR